MGLRKSAKTYIAPVVMSSFILSAGCGSPVYRGPGLDQAKQTHKIVAVLPFNFMSECSELRYRIGEDKIDSARVNLALDYQRELYKQILARQQKGEYSVIFQDTDSTDTLLERANITFDNLPGYDKKTLADILGVDAVIATSIPCPEPPHLGGGVGGVILLYLLINPLIPDRTTAASMEIYNSTDGQLLWRYDYKSSRFIGLDPEPLVTALMKKSSKKFPYILKK